jgi:hydrogen peroxide-dependent heme synthase
MQVRSTATVEDSAQVIAPSGCLTSGHRLQEMTEPLVPSTGWGVLHLFVKARPQMDAEAVKGAVKVAREAEHQVVIASLLGHKADACFMLLGPDLWRAREFQTALQQAGLEVVDSYVSLTEVSDYAEGMTEGMKRPRLYPKLPPEDMRAFCFYPMSKRRNDVNNWYALPFEKRKELMYEHGMSGRKFSGRVLQLVSGSTGVDDYEWGVTLFGVHPDDLKAAVYTMRFDEASTLYGEFGRFYSGMVADIDDVLANLHA